MKRPFKVGILGAGRIAQGFDNPRSNQILTLAHAVRECAGLELGGFYDKDVQRTIAAEKKWSCPETSRDFKTWLKQDWDIFCIATPDDQHLTDLQALLPIKPKAILVEKPLGEDSTSAIKWLKQARKLSVPVMVNYPRRWHPGVQQTGKWLQQDKLGHILRVEITCSGGLLHNGSHALDLIAGWCPPVQRVVCVQQSLTHKWFRLVNKSGDIDLFLTSATQKECYVWEVRVETDLGRVEFTGIPEQLILSAPQEHPNFPGFQGLQPRISWPMEKEPLLLYAMQHLQKIARSTAAATEHLEMELDRQQFLHRFYSQMQPGNHGHKSR